MQSAADEVINPAGLNSGYEVPAMLETDFGTQGLGTECGSDSIQSKSTKHGTAWEAWLVDLAVSRK